MHCPGDAEQHREEDRVRVARDARERDRPDPRRAAEQSADDGEPYIVLAPQDLVLGDDFEVHLKLSTLLGQRDDTSVRLVVDEPALRQLRQVRLVERGVDALPLFVRHLVDLEVVLPRRQLLGNVADAGVIPVFFQISDHVSSPSVAQRGENLAARGSVSVGLPVLFGGDLWCHTRVERGPDPPPRGRVCL